MATPVETAAMRRALLLAADASVPLGPNPRVGAVILDTHDEVVGQGCHRGAGTDHAEVAALQAAGKAAVGGTAVVTLEPCNHQGRTGPCSTALIEAGVTRVVFGQSDAGELASGGADRLREAGLSVEGGVLAGEAAELNPIFSRSNETRRPFVTYKFAATLDGRIAAPDGTSQWITGESARRDVHRLREQVDAILVGTGTVFADDPALTVRGDEATEHQPLRVVMGMRDLPPQAVLLRDGGPVLHLRTHDPIVVIGELKQRGVHHLLVEGGPTVGSAFVRAGLVDRVVAYLAPMLFGAGPSALSDAGVTTLTDATRHQVTDVTQLDQDVRITADVLEGK